MPNVFDEFAELFEDVRIKFGLRAQGHVPTIERMLADGKSWDEIGAVIHWHPKTAKEYWDSLEGDSPTG